MTPLTMRRWSGAAAITRVELLRVARDRTALFFIVVLPVVIIIIIGATIGAAPRNIPIGLVDGDNSASSRRLIAALETSDVLSTSVFRNVEDLQTEIRIQNIAGGVAIPEGYGQAAQNGRNTTVQLFADQTNSAALTVRTVVRSIVDQQAAASAAALFASEQTGAELADAIATAEALQTTLPVFAVNVSTVGRESLSSTNQYAYTAPSNLVLFVFINSLTSAAAMVESRRYGITRRTLAAPVTPGTIVAGFAATRLLIALFQSALILGVGSVFFGVDWGDPLGAVALVAVFALLSTGAGLLLGTLARSPEQAQAFGIPVAIGMAMLGGCMWPLEIVPAAVRTAAHITPHAWAMDGWITLIFDGGGLGAIAGPMAVLTSIAGVLLGAATLRTRRTLGT